MTIELRETAPGAPPFVDLGVALHLTVRTEDGRDLTLLLDADGTAALGDAIAHQVLDFTKWAQEQDEA